MGNGQGQDDVNVKMINKGGECQGDQHDNSVNMINTGGTVVFYLF